MSRPNCDICWVIRNSSYCYEDAYEDSPAEKRERAKQQKMRIAKDIVNHHQDIAKEINRLSRGGKS